MTIKEAQEAVDQWIKEYGVRYFSELTNMACLTEDSWAQTADGVWSLSDCINYALAHNVYEERKEFFRN